VISFVQTPAIPNQIPLAFDQALSRTDSELRWAVAYVTKFGCEDLINRLRVRSGSRWGALAKTIIVSFDYGITEPPALEFLRHDNWNVKVASPEVLTRTRLLPINAFHPKLYLFGSATGLSVISGSANLTRRALTANHEVVALHTFLAADPAWEQAWRDVASGAVDVTPELLRQYQDARRRNPPPVDIDPAAPAPRPPAARQLPLFWDELQAGRLNPPAFAQFWVEAGSMSSSASHNQLELPRGGNRFFRFAFTRYQEHQADIGRLVLLVRNQPHSNRKLAWHGDNGMERVYLPTEAQSGLRYRDQCVLFRRTPAGFTVDVFPWQSAQAVACRTASHQANNLYRLGAASPRICGLY
jgi:hypothetical protein